MYSTKGEASSAERSGALGGSGGGAEGTAPGWVDYTPNHINKRMQRNEDT
jgi:hypothetical protein